MLYTLPQMGFINISGKDAAKFLQGQLTCDINSLTETLMLPGAYCSQQGRVQATFRIFKFNDSFYLYLPMEMIPIVIDLLQKYAIFSKVMITDSSKQLTAIGFLGAEIEVTLLSNHYILPTTYNEVTYHNNCWLARMPGTTPRYLLMSSNQTIDTLLGTLPSKSILEQDAWKLCDIEQGFPIIYQQTRDQFTPHVLHYDRLGGISFNKGCYIGQEIIARTHYRGQVKQHLHRALIASADTPMPGAKIVDRVDSTVGTIINAAKRNGNEYEALAVLQESAIQPGEIYFAGAKLVLLPLSYAKPDKAL